ncbi:hypothetical protein PUN28_005862 [Cardiocondyla obscurior]|uniref:Uncharacterized protein n=1 Tax=Cardiocondyla obscurior TaxID=286306 RepID=A0AAW2GBG5_9HYME
MSIHSRIAAKFRTRIDVPLGVGAAAARSQTLIYAANQSQWRSVEGDRAFKLVEVSRLRSSSNTLPQLGYAAVNRSQTRAQPRPSTRVPSVRVYTVSWKLSPSHSDDGLNNFFFLFPLI